MNRIFLLLLTALLLSANPAFGFITPNITVYTSLTEASGHTGGEELTAKLAEQVKNGVKKAFPCVAILTQKDIKSLVDKEREREVRGDYYFDHSLNESFNKEIEEILDKERQKNRQPILDAVGSRYYIFLRVNCIGRTQTINLLFKDRQTSKNDMGFSCESNNGDIGPGPVNAMVGELIEKLAYLEICPYSGPVNVTVRSVVKKKSDDDHQVFCNNTDGIFKQSNTLEKTTDQNWKLKRIGKPDTYGEMTATISEKEEEHVEDDCHSCSSGSRQGGRIYNKSTFISASVNGLSTRTRILGEKENHDAAIYLRFDQNGTYMIDISGSSEAADYKGKIIETAEGTCDSINKTVNMNEDQIMGKINHNRSLPLTAKCGPFPGTPFDKRLSEKKELKLKDAMGEETTITIDFDLQRK